jgi:hypothetical protein
MFAHIALRTLFFILIISGIGLIYIDAVILKDFDIYTSPEGPDTTDYFETLAEE